MSVYQNCYFPKRAPLSLLPFRLLYLHTMFSGTAVGQDSYKRGHLIAKPHATPVIDAPPTGLISLDVKAPRKNLLYVPENYNASSPASLAVMLHGAGADSDQGIFLLRDYADDNNMILVAPASKSSSWDMISSRVFGPDVALVDQCLSHVFAHYAVDTARIAVGGFSDGASYALSLGLGNGDLFTHVIAFSPGFYRVDETKGKPKIFISHGTEDRVLNIDRCSRRIREQLNAKGYPLVYKEFNGGHTIPGSITREAVSWFTKKEII